MVLKTVGTAVLAACLLLPLSRTAESKGGWLTFDICAEQDGDFSKLACDSLITDPHTTPAIKFKSLVNRARIHDNNDRLDEALADLNAALVLDPACADVYSSRMMIFKRMKKTEETLADLTKLIEMQPTHLDWYALRAQVHFEQGNKDAALADYRKMVELDGQARDKQMYDEQRARAEARRRAKSESPAERSGDME